MIKDQFKVEVTLKPSDVSKTEDYWLSNRNTLTPMIEWWEQARKGQFDPYFKEEEALRVYQKNYKRRMDEAAKAVEAVLAADQSVQTAGSFQASSGRLVRKIYHPLFKNLNSKEAEDYLKDKGSGEIVIRPSSKDKDTLIITWAFQVYVFECHSEYSRKIGISISKLKKRIKPQVAETALANHCSSTVQVIAFPIWMKSPLDILPR